jgi:futalosine hydrolase
MSKILIVSATQQEIQPLLDFLDQFKVQKDVYRIGNNEIKILVTGVGMVATAFACTKELLTNKYDWALNLGIAGAFNRDLNLGEVVQAETEQLSELGAQDDEKFLSLFDLGLLNKNEFPFTNEKLYNTAPGTIDLSEHKRVSAITVNTVHGKEKSISEIQQRLNPDIESMEGAAFFYCCIMLNIPCVQLRAISNYVEKRNRSAWQIVEAVNNLNNSAIKLLNNLS